MIKFFKSLKKKSYNKDSNTQFNNDLTALYNNFFSRIEPKNWDKLIHDAANKYHWYMDIISDRLLDFLMSNYNLPYEIWILLNEHFQWSRGSSELSQAYPKDFIQFILANINHEYRLRYNLFTEKINGSYDDFINSYYRACFELKNKDLYKAEQSILKAKQIFSGHPDLIILEGIFYIEVNSVENALKKFCFVINSNSKSFDAYLNRADTYIRIGKLHEAYEDYKSCLVLDPDNTKVQYRLGDCCLYMDNYQEAVDIYNRILEKFPDDKHIAGNLNSATNFLKLG